MSGAAISIFVTAGVFSLIFGAMILRAFAFSVLWGWFIVPFFHLPPVNVPLALGIMVTIGEITRQYVPAKDKEVWMPICTALLSPLMALLLGWIARFWL